MLEYASVIFVVSFFFFFYVIRASRFLFLLRSLTRNSRLSHIFEFMFFLFFLYWEHSIWKKKLRISRILHRILFYFRKKLHKILRYLYQFVFAQIIIFLCYLHWIFSSILFEIAKNGVFLTICDGNLSFFFVFRFYSILNNEFRKLHDEAEIC